MQTKIIEYGETKIPLELRGNGEVLVDREHIILFAKNNCKMCFGRGTVTKVVAVKETVQGGHKVKERKNISDVCGCAIKRFQKQLPKDWIVRRLTYAWEAIGGQQTNSVSEANHVK